MSPLPNSCQWCWDKPATRKVEKARDNLIDVCAQCHSKIIDNKERYKELIEEEDDD